MKNLYKIEVLICIILMITFNLTGCKWSGKTEERPEINKKDINEYTEYVHSSGVKFSYPKSWKSLGTASEPSFGDTLTGTSVNYVSVSVPITYSIDSYVSETIENIKKEREVVGEVEKQNVKLNGKDASIIKYTVTQSDTNLVLKQAFFMDDGSAHILSVVSFESNYDEESETMDNIINSFMK